MKEFVGKIKNLIANGELEKAFEQLNACLKETSYENESIGLNARFYNYKESERKGIKSTTELGLEINKVSNDILSFLDELVKADIECHKSESPQEQKATPIFCYVICSTKERVKEILGEECFSCLDAERYHETEQKSWKPYTEQITIEEILDNFRKKYGYQFKEEYLDENIIPQQRGIIDDFKSSCIVIVDLLSMSVKNRLLVTPFDTETIGGVLIPICESLKANSDLKQIVKEAKENVFPTLNYKRSLKPCFFYEKNLSEYEDFAQSLMRLFSFRFPVENKLPISNEARKFIPKIA